MMTGGRRRLLPTMHIKSRDHTIFAVVVEYALGGVPDDKRVNRAAGSKKVHCNETDMLAFRKIVDAEFGQR